MSRDLNASTATDPLRVLGLPPGASEQDIRRRYLELVRQSPPERDPVRFREIHAAYQAASDPLARAEDLLRTLPTRLRPWEDVIEAHRDRRPRLDVDSLISLGNRSRDSSNAPDATP